MRVTTLLPLLLLACGPKDWRQAKKIGTADAYRAVAVDLTHKKRAKAAQRAERLDWEAAEEADSSRAWKAYISHNPTSPRVPEARGRRDEAHWAELLRQNSRTALEAWLAMNGASRHAKEARILIDELAWQEALAGGDAESFGRYIVRYPSGPHAEQARERRDELAWQVAVERDDPKSYQAYLDDNPRGLHVADAKHAIKGFRFSGVAVRVVGHKLYRPDSLSTYERELKKTLGKELASLGFDVAWLPPVDATGVRAVNPLAGLVTSTPEDHAALVLEVSETRGLPFEGGGYQTVISAEVHLVPPARTEAMDVRQVEAASRASVEGVGNAVLHHDAQQALGLAVLEAGFGLEGWRR